MSYSHFASPTGVAFRHVVEDGLSILSATKDVPETRREYVIDGLAKLFRSATEGSELIVRGRLSVGLASHQAIESFSFIERQVGSIVDSVHMQAASTAFSSLKINASIDAGSLAAAIAMLEELLANLRRADDGAVSSVSDEMLVAR